MVEAYTGDVEVGGPPADRDLGGGLHLTKLAVGPMDNNAYVLRWAPTGEALLVDAANEPDRLLGVLGEHRLRLVVTTHQHGDHWQALPEVVAATGARVACHPDDAGPIPVTATQPLRDGDEVRIGDASLQVIHLVGHTPGSIALRYDGTGGDARPHLFTGDSLFPGGPGNTFGDADNHRRLLDDLEAKVFDRLPDETWVYPGHGKDTTLGAERPHLPEWRERGW
jgi:glyoxylase-like metal-dependent hydrolase (beta-lactamase superfamily II)